MLYGNISRLELLPYIDNKLINIVNEALEIANQGCCGKFSLSYDDVFVMINDAETGSINNRRAEVHREYIDIQILINGNETIGYSNKTPQTLLDESVFDKDIAFVDNVTDENFIHLQTGDFALFYPYQVHRPLCQVNGPAYVKKAIIKIPKTLFDH